MHLSKVLAALTLGVAAVICAPSAQALPPSPFCPGDGTTVTIIGIGGGYCDMLYMPDGSYVHCEFGGVAPGYIEIVAVSNCWRVGPDGHPIPHPPFIHPLFPPSPDLPPSPEEPAPDAPPV